MNVETLPAHSVHGASSYDRWKHCPGSIRESRGIEKRSSSFADEGTAAHWLADKCLSEKRWPKQFAGFEIPVNGVGHIVDDDMIEAVDTYLIAIASRTNSDGSDEVESEVKFHLKDLHPNLWGTADCTIYKPAERKLIVVDFKYGKGIPVDPKRNPQLMYYGYGAATKKANRGVGAVELVIVQPRCPMPGDDTPGVRTWNTSALELMDTAADLIEDVRATEAPDAPLHAGDWCKFCPAAPTCHERRASLLRDMKAEFGNDGSLALAEPPTMPVADRVKVFAVREQIKDWLKRLDEFEHHEAESGRPLPGWKLVAKRATRKWKDPTAVGPLLVEGWGFGQNEIMTEPELRSPAQVEKLLPAKRRKELGDLYESVSSGTVLAPESDPRPAATSAAAAEFSA